jgi:uncharacterized heparinase superfamily protein
MMSKIARYWHTLRYLRPVQVYGRLWFKLYRPGPEVRPAPAVRPVRGPWVVPIARPVSLLGPTRLRFLNATHDLAPGPEAWNDPARDKLWLYNLHYFDDLNAAPSPWHLALLQRWVAENPPGVGNGWEPYPTSLRIVNWIKWVLTPQGLRGSRALSPECQHSLAVQARWLRRRLEYHLLGNHLFANAKALVFAGAFFLGPEGAAGAVAREPASWLALGQRLLRRELVEQILPDGGHFERSPMYHAILLEDVLDVLNLAGAYPGTLEAGLVARCREQAAAMLRWLGVMCHPDGEIGFFNDAAMGIAPRLAELVAYGERLGVAGGHAETRPGSVSAPVWLRDSGYVHLTDGPAVALLDVAPIGPDYLPGHAHADTLSFELSLFGQRVIVNGGTSRYGTGPERLVERGTAAHSTVQIDGADSSEVWGGFRVARRARPFAVEVTRGASEIPPWAVEVSPRWDEAGVNDDLGALGADGVVGGTAQPPVQRVTAAHDGYRRLPGRPVHRRTWELTPERLLVVDRLEGRFGVAVARFHLHPAIGIEGPAMAIEGPVFASAGPAMTGEGIEPNDGGGPLRLPPGGYLLLPSGQRVRWQVTGGRVRLVPDHWHPGFGLSVASRCLEVWFEDGVCRLDLTWAAGG